MSTGSHLGDLWRNQEYGSSEQTETHIGLPRVYPTNLPPQHQEPYKGESTDNFSEGVNASQPDSQENCLAEAPDGASSDLLPNLAIKHPKMINSTMESRGRKKEVKRSLTQYHMSEHTTGASAREGKCEREEKRCSACRGMETEQEGEDGEPFRPGLLPRGPLRWE